MNLLQICAVISLETLGWFKCQERFSNYILSNLARHLPVNIGRPEVSFVYISVHRFFLLTGLSHEQNMHKMRILTFMQIAEGKTELGYDQIQKELQLLPEEVEAFVFDGRSTLLSLLFTCSQFINPISANYIC